MNFVFIGSVTVNPPIKIPPNPKCSDNFCRQECRDIPNEGAKCYCRSGYQLQSDRVSCQGKITMNAHFRVFYLFLNIPRPPIQRWDATEQLRRAQSHIRWARNKDLLLPCFALFFFFFAFLGMGGGEGRGRMGMLLVRVLFFSCCDIRNRYKIRKSLRSVTPAPKSASCRIF